MFLLPKIMFVGLALKGRCIKQAIQARLLSLPRGAWSSFTSYQPYALQLNPNERFFAISHMDKLHKSEEIPMTIDIFCSCRQNKTKMK
jgi:hypothetical protein